MLQKIILHFSFRLDKRLMNYYKFDNMISEHNVYCQMFPIRKYDEIFHFWNINVQFQFGASYFLFSMPFNLFIH